MSFIDKHINKKIKQNPKFEKEFEQNEILKTGHLTRNFT